MIPVVGASTVTQLEEQLGAVDLHLDEEVRKRLDTAGRPPTARPAEGLAYQSCGTRSGPTMWSCRPRRPRGWRRG
jgi:diketogulonate reductase-like aldo/keto reductase